MAPPSAEPAPKPKRKAGAKQQAHLDNIRAKAVAARRAKAAAARAGPSVASECHYPDMAAVAPDPSPPKPRVAAAPAPRPAALPGGGFKEFMQHMSMFNDLHEKQARKRKAAEELEQALEAKVEARVRAKILAEQKSQPQQKPAPPASDAANLPDYASYFM